MLDKISELIILIVWIWSVTYLLSLLIMGLFGKWTKYQNKQIRLMLKQENGDPIGILFTHERKTNEDTKEKTD